VTKLVQSEELEQKLLIGKFLIKLNSAISAHKWFDGDSRQTYEDSSEIKVGSQSQPLTPSAPTSPRHPDSQLEEESLDLEDAEAYESIPSVSSLLLHERPGHYFPSYHLLLSSVVTSLILWPLVLLPSPCPSPMNRLPSTTFGK
jgi:hypothetical protein